MRRSSTPPLWTSGGPLGSNQQRATNNHLPGEPPDLAPVNLSSREPPNREPLNREPLNREP